MKLKIVLVSAAFILYGSVSAQESKDDSIKIREIYNLALLPGKSYSNLNYLTARIGSRLYASSEAEKASGWAIVNQQGSEPGGTSVGSFAYLPLKQGLQNQAPKKALYSPTRTANGFTFLSGQIGISPVTNKLIKSSFTEQAGQVFQNIELLLKKEGLSMKDVISVTIYLTDISNYDPVNTVYARYFAAPYPTRVCVAVKSLPGGADIEVALMAANINK